MDAMMAEALREAKRRLHHQPLSPQPVQKQLLQSEAFEVLFGGQAGGGKSVGLLMDAGQQTEHSKYAAILFRRTYKQLDDPGGLRPRSFEVYPRLGAKYHNGGYEWEFPSKAVIVFRHLQYSQDRFDYAGAEFTYIGFDQLEQQEEDDYLYLFSRTRSTDPSLQKKVRSSANPGAEWILRRWLAWLGTDDELSQAGLPRAKPGELLWFKRVNDQDTLADEKDPDALSRTFIPATVYDNPALIQNDPDYVRRLKALPYIDRRRLLDGDWHIKATKGTVLKREWFGNDVFVPVAPPLPIVCRAFDFAGTEKQTQKDDPDYTATVKVGLDDFMVPDAYVWVTDAYQDRLSPLSVEKLVEHYHQIEPPEVTFVMEQEPGQAGKAQVYRYMRSLKGRRVVAWPQSKDKVTRAQAFASIVEAGGFRMVKASWNGWYINHLVNFPDPGWHDDVVDATTIAYNFLTQVPPKAKVRRLIG
jgi:predicted phage terminase large subunit-like protein